MASGKPIGSMDQGGGFECLQLGASQSIIINSNSFTNGIAFSPKTSVLTLFATSDCFIAIGFAPTAQPSGSSYFLPAGIRDFVGVLPNQSLAVTQRVGAGTLYITEGG